MKKSLNKKPKNTNNNTNGFIPNSFKFISSCIKTVSSNVRSAGASVAGSISTGSNEHQKDQVLWSCFDRLDLGPSIKRVLLLGYSNGFQVLDVEDASSVVELVSRRDDPVTFLQMQPIPEKSECREGFRASHPLLVVVACDEVSNAGPIQNDSNGLLKDGFIEPHGGNILSSPRSVRFYSLRSHNYVHVLRFRSTVYMVRCSQRIVAVGLATQIYCFDAITFENKFSVLTYPAPQLGGQGFVGVNVGYGPMDVGPRWLAYASNNPLMPNTGRLSPQSLGPSPGVSPSTSPGSGSLVARYAMESSKQLAAGLVNLGDMGYKTLSKYCHELLPDGSSSPVSSNSSWKVGRVAAHSSETDTAGMVVIKDFVSRAVVSQFRAHTSSISALCFDPSGTLLVTASIHGNNINIFRIVPSCSQNGSGTQSNDWSYSHVHLYKLHRGMTSAVIQDICFSSYSQWIAIVSSKGTCHIFVLSPFGGETGLQIQNSHVVGPALSPILSIPWWSTSSYMINLKSFYPPPPATITLSAVSRIRHGNSRWLDTVSNAASSAAGKVSVPTGVVAAVFHSSVRHNLLSTLSNVNAMEHLLVYTPPGNVIQYELLPSNGGEQDDSSLPAGIGSQVHMQEEIGVKVEPAQWWDVCRRADWPEREECIYGLTLGGQGAAETIMDSSDNEDNGIVEKDSVRSHERSHWYLSNAEVQIRSGRIPIWQKSKISFYTMSLYGCEEDNRSKDHTGGEIEIEKIPSHEVEIRRKDLLPVFDSFHRIHPGWSGDRGLAGERYSTSSSNSRSGGGNILEDTAIFHTKLSSPDSVQNLHARSAKTPTVLHDLDHIGTVKPSPPIGLVVNENDRVNRSSSILPSAPLNKRSFGGVDTSVSPVLSAKVVSRLQESFVVNSPPPPKIGSLSTGGTVAREVNSSDSVVTSEASNSSSNRSDSSMNILDEGPVHQDMHDPLDFGQYFQEGYCKASPHDECRELTEVCTDIDSSNSPYEKEKSEEDAESDDMLGGVFSFSEEG
ncbi:unnamed protein product [Ilex paraguariensis]|uniref:Autophagy-related protein 18h n=1 Tax=Ilex paraguariensis TaxID=185542 RepID=A0ABC8TYV3_9AQUA